MNFDFLDKRDGTASHNLILLKCNSNKLQDTISQLTSSGVNTINVGQELSKKLIAVEFGKHISIEAQEYLHELIDKNSTQIVNGKPKIVALYNMGILLEETLSLNTESLLKKFSKNLTIVVVWEHVYSNGLLHWGEQQKEYHLNLSDIFVAEENANYEI
jgi:hypothetical protein